MTTNSPFFVQISDIFVRLLGEWPCRHRGSHLDVWPCQNDSFILDPEKVICSTIDDLIKILKKVKKVTVTLGRIFSFKKLLYSYEATENKLILIDKAKRHTRRYTSGKREAYPTNYPKLSRK